MWGIINIHIMMHFILQIRPLIISASCCVFIKMHIANYLDIHSLKVRFKKGTHYHISLKFYIYLMV